MNKLKKIFNKLFLGKQIKKGDPKDKNWMDNVSRGISKSIYY